MRPGKQGITVVRQAGTQGRRQRHAGTRRRRLQVSFKLCCGVGARAAAVALESSLNTALGRALSAASGAPPAGVIRLRPRAVGADGRPAAWRVKTGSGGAPSTLRHRSAALCAARRSAATWRIARSAVCIPTFWGPNGWPAGTSVGGNGVRGCLEHPR